jgi:hypothetical protein
MNDLCGHTFHRENCDLIARKCYPLRGEHCIWFTVTAARITGFIFTDQHPTKFTTALSIAKFICLEQELLV